MKIKTRRLGVALAAATATMALSGIGAGGAQAAPLCTGASIEGGGSSLQRAAQTIWTSLDSATTGFNGTGSANGCSSGTPPTVRYTVSSSGACLATFGADTGTIGSTTTTFCGTDDAPTSTQITNITTATRAKVLSVPVAQAAIAIVVNPPSGCTVTSGNISPSKLQQVFAGTTTSWTNLGTAAACNGQTINRVVRNDVSGTTYQFKHYLFSQNSGAVHGTLTWADLQSVANNTTWPGTVTKSQSGCATAMALNCSGGANSGSGGSDEVRTVAATSGSIGYAALSDARSVYGAQVGTSPNLRWLNVDGINPSSVNTLSATPANSNCPTGITGAYGTPPSATAAWSGVYLTNPGTSYPICTLTWDLALNDYTHWGAASVTNGRTVRDYLGYVLSDGQTQFANNDYAVLPSDVLEAATTGVAEIKNN